MKRGFAKLQMTMVTIHAVLLDAVKEWTKRLKSVLYDAEDLFDEVTTEDLLKQQMMEEGSNKLSLKKKVRVSCSKLNPVVSRNSIAKRVKATRKNLVDFSTDMAQFECVKKRNQYARDVNVIGRDGDKETIFSNSTIREWEALEKEDLPQLGRKSLDCSRIY
ncbi:hypothetical protein V2J09_012349 [Rumex salicifolius]